MRVLLCLLSEQHVPNLLSVHHFKPDRLVLIESAGMRRRLAADNLLAALKLGGLDCRTERAGGLSCHVELLEDENDLLAIRRCIENVIRSEPPAEWIVNLTGGTKPMSIAAYDAFLNHDARLVYAPVNQPDCFLDFRGGPRERCAYRPAVQEFLAGYGFQFAKVSELVAASERKAAERREAALAIARVVGSHALVHLDSDKEWNTALKNGIVFKQGQLKPPSDEVASILARTFQLAPTNGHLVGKVDRGGFQFLAGGWLEVFIWDLLVRHREALGIWDLHLGLHVRHAEKKLSQNEFDVAFLCDFTLGLVECKSGAQRIDRDTKVLYQLAALTRQFGAVRALSWLVTMSPNVWQRDAGTFKPEIADRAALYGCRIVDQNMVRQLAERPDDAELVRQTFFPTTSEASTG